MPMQWHAVSLSASFLRRRLRPHRRHALNVAVFEALKASPEKLALLAAVAIAAEALQRIDDELLPDAEGERFSLTWAVQIAAILIGGPWIAAAVAGWSVVAVAPFRNMPFVHLVRRAGALALAALAGGFALQAAGAVAGQMHLPDDMLPVALAGLVYVTVRTLLEGLVDRRVVLRTSYRPQRRSDSGSCSRSPRCTRCGSRSRSPAPAARRASLRPRGRPASRDGDRARDVRQHRGRAGLVDVRALDAGRRPRERARERTRVSEHARSGVCGGPAACTISARSPSTRR